jgi:hypothetical protein
MVAVVRWASLHGDGVHVHDAGRGRAVVVVALAAVIAASATAAKRRRERNAEAAGAVVVARDADRDAHSGLVCFLGVGLRAQMEEWSNSSCWFFCLSNAAIMLRPVTCAH